jgi:gliding-associated putative ABC transporter substrate-binding component GldG
MNKRKADIFQFLLIIGIFCSAAIISSFVKFKIDLTADDRYTLSKSTLTFLDSIQTPIYVRVYLHGEFPADYRELEENVGDLLAELNSESHGMIEYEFIDPYEEQDEKKRNEIFQALKEKGLNFSNITFERNGAKSNKYIWPGALLEINGKEVPVNFLKSEIALDNAQMLAYSSSNLEYEFMSTIHRALKRSKPIIGVLEGHDELNGKQLARLVFSLKDNYNIFPVKLTNDSTGKEDIDALTENLEGNLKMNKYDLLIVPGPKDTISDKEIYLIDQFIMNGGRTLWLIDGMKLNLDSIKNGETTIGIANETGLNKALYEYGVRINRDLIIDFQGAPIFLDAGPLGTQRSCEERTNYFFPVITSEKNAHPISANLDPILTQFPSSIDTVNSNPAIKKSVLLSFSQKSKQLRSPARVGLELLRFNLDYFNDDKNANKILGVLLEGNFKSALFDILPEDLKTNPTLMYKSESGFNKMIVIADPDIAKNQIQYSSGKWYPMPLDLHLDTIPAGCLDQYSNPIFTQKYDNSDLLNNCVNYLLDNNALIDIRSKRIIVRKLDKVKISHQKNYWKTLNTVSPLFLLAILGTVLVYSRKKRWTKLN